MNGSELRTVLTRLRDLWAANATGDRRLKGVALFEARAVWASQLAVEAEEPPPAHANLVGWPWLEADSAMQKNQQLEQANQLAAAATRLLL